MTDKLNPINFWNKHRYADTENDESNQPHSEQRSSSIDQTNNASAQREPIHVLPSDIGVTGLNREQDSNMKHDTEDMISRKNPTNFDFFKMKNDELSDNKIKQEDSTIRDENISFFGDSNVARRTSRSTLDQDGLHRGNISTLPSAGNNARRSSMNDSLTEKPTFMGRASAAVASVGAAAATLGMPNELRNKSTIENTEMPSTWPDSSSNSKNDIVEPAIHGQNACFHTKDQVCDNITESDDHSFCARVKEPTIQGQTPSFYGHENTNVNNNRQAVNTIDAVNNNNQDVNNLDTINNKNNNRLSGDVKNLFGNTSDESKSTNKKGLLAGAGAGLGAGLGGLLSLHKNQSNHATTPEMLPDHSSKNKVADTNEDLMDDNQEFSEDYQPYSGATAVPHTLAADRFDDKSITDSMNELPKTWGDQSSPIILDNEDNFDSGLNDENVDNPSTHVKISHDDDNTSHLAGGSAALAGGAGLAGGGSAALASGANNTRSLSGSKGNLKVAPLSDIIDRVEERQLNNSGISQTNDMSPADTLGFVKERQLNNSNGPLTSAMSHSTSGEGVLGGVEERQLNNSNVPQANDKSHSSMDERELSNSKVPQTNDKSHSTSAAGILGGVGLGAGITAAVSSMLDYNNDKSEDTSASKVEDATEKNTLDNHGDIMSPAEVGSPGGTGFGHRSHQDSDLQNNTGGVLPVSREEQYENISQNDNKSRNMTGILGGAGVGAGLGAATHSLLNDNKKTEEAPVSKLDSPMNQNTMNDPRVNQLNNSTLNDMSSNTTGAIDGASLDNDLSSNTTGAIGGASLGNDNTDHRPVWDLVSSTEATPTPKVDNRPTQNQLNNSEASHNNKPYAAAGILGGAGVGAAAHSILKKDKETEVAPVTKLDNPIDQNTLNDPRVNHHNDTATNALEGSGVDSSTQPMLDRDITNAEATPVSKVDDRIDQGNLDESKDTHDSKNKSGAAAGVLGGAGIGATIHSILKHDKKDKTPNTKTGTLSETADRSILDHNNATDAVPVSATNIIAEQKSFGNNKDQAFGGGSAFGSNTGATAIVNNVVPAAASAPIIKKSLKINSNNENVQSQNEDFGITSAPPIAKEEPIANDKSIVNDKHVANDKPVTSEEPITLNQPWTDKEVDQGSATEPRRWSDAATTPRSASVNHKPVAINEPWAAGREDNEVPASEARRWSKSDVPPSHHVEKRLAVGGIMGATANVEGVRGLNKLYPENSHMESTNEPIKVRLGEDEITDQPRRRSSVSETVSNLFGLHKHKEGGKHGDPILEDNHHDFAQAPLSTSNIESHNKAAVAGGNLDSALPRDINGNNKSESISSTRATTGQIVPDARNVEVKDRTGAPLQNDSTLPDSNKATHNSERKDSGFKTKAAAATGAFASAVRRLSSKHSSNSSIRKDSIHVRRLSDAEVFKNNTLGKQNVFGNNENAAVGSKLPATTGTGVTEGSTEVNGIHHYSSVGPLSPDQDVAGTGVGPLTPDRNVASSGAVPVSQEMNTIGTGVGPLTNEKNAAGVHPLSSNTEPAINNEMDNSEKRKSSADSEHLKYTGVHKEHSRIPGVHSLKPLGTGDVSNNENNFVKQEEVKTSMGTFISGKLENRRGSIQKTVGRMFGSGNMQDKGALKELSGQQKVNAYRAAHNQL